MLAHGKWRVLINGEVLNPVEGVEAGWVSGDQAGRAQLPTSSPHQVLHLVGA